MVVSSRVLCGVYGVVALLALIATWHQNLNYVGADDPFTGTMRFWRETVTTSASISIMVDLFLFALAVVVWMLVEARRLGIRFVWLYVVAGALIAISVSVPLFLIARERRRQQLRPADDAAVALAAGDLVGLGLLALPTLALTLWSLFR